MNELIKLETLLKEQGTIKNHQDYLNLFNISQLDSVTLDELKNKALFTHELYSPSSVSSFMNCIKQTSREHGTERFGAKLSKISFLPANQGLEASMKEYGMIPELKSKEIHEIIENLDDSELELSVTRMTILFAAIPYLNNGVF